MVTIINQVKCLKASDLTLKLAGGRFVEPPPPRFFGSKIVTPGPIAKRFCTTVPLNDVIILIDGKRSLLSKLLIF